MNEPDVRIEARKDPEQLAREIDTTRANLGQTLDALQAKLSPGQLLDQAVSMFRGQSGEFAHNLGEQVKANPLPVALIGAGIAWMIASQRRGSSAPREDEYEVPVSGETYEYASGASSSAPGMREKVRQKAAAARERVAHARSGIAHAGSSVAQTGSNIAHRVGAAAGSAKTQAARAGEGFGRMMDEQPLVLAALGVALGAAIGAMLPASEKEDRLLGAASDRTRERAKALGSEQYEQAREKVKEGAQTVREALTERKPGGDRDQGRQSMQDPGAAPTPPPPGL